MQKFWAAMVLAAACAPAAGQTANWANPAGGLWHTADNWSPVGVPSGAGRDVVIDLPGGYDVNVLQQINVGAIRIDNPDARLVVDVKSSSFSGPRSTIRADRLEVVAGTYIQRYAIAAPGSSPTANASLSIPQIDNSGLFRLESGGDFYYAGNIALNNHPGGRIELEIASLVPDRSTPSEPYSSITVTNFGEVFISPSAVRTVLDIVNHGLTHIARPTFLGNLEQFAGELRMDESGAAFNVRIEGGVFTGDSHLRANGRVTIGQAAGPTRVGLRSFGIPTSTGFAENPLLDVQRRDTQGRRVLVSGEQLFVERLDYPLSNTNTIAPFDFRTASDTDRPLVNLGHISVLRTIEFQPTPAAGGHGRLLLPLGANGSGGLLNQGTISFTGAFTPSAFAAPDNGTITSTTTQVFDIHGALHNDTAGVIDIQTPVTVGYTGDGTANPGAAFRNDGIVNISAGVPVHVYGSADTTALSGGRVNVSAGASLRIDGGFTMTGGVIEGEGLKEWIIRRGATSTRIVIDGGAVRGTVTLASASGSSGTDPILDLRHVVEPIELVSTSNHGLTVPSGIPENATMRWRGAQLSTSGSDGGPLINHGVVTLEYTTRIAALRSNAIDNRGTMLVDRATLSPRNTRDHVGLFNSGLIHASGAGSGRTQIAFATIVNQAGGQLVLDQAATVGTQILPRIPTPTFTNAGLLSVRGAAVTVDAQVFNTGTIENLGGTLTFSRAVTSSGAIVLDPSTTNFTDLTITGGGTITADVGDLITLTGDLTLTPDSAAGSDLSGATIEFLDGTDSKHTLKVNDAGLGVMVGTLRLRFGQSLKLDQIGPGSPILRLDTLHLDGGSFQLAQLTGPNAGRIEYQSLVLWGVTHATPGVVLLPEPNLLAMATPAVVLLRRRGRTIVTPRAPRTLSL